jgi:hypothetical protein
LCQGNKKAGPLGFKVKSGATGHILICQPKMGTRPKDSGTLDANAEFHVNDEPMPLADKQWIASHKVESPTCFISNQTYPPGEHRITIIPTSDEKYIMVSGIVWQA